MFQTPGQFTGTKDPWCPIMTPARGSKSREGQANARDEFVTTILSIVLLLALTSTQTRSPI